MHDRIFSCKTLIDSSGLCHFFGINAIRAIFILKNQINKKTKWYLFCALYYIFDVIVCVCLNVCIYVRVFIFILQYH